AIIPLGASTMPFSLIWSMTRHLLPVVQPLPVPMAFTIGLMNGSRMPAIERRAGCSFTTSIGFSSGFFATGALVAIAGLAAVTLFAFLSAGLMLIAGCVTPPFFADANV